MKQKKNPAKINNIKRYVFEKINKIHKTLVKLTRIKEKIQNDQY